MKRIREPDVTAKQLVQEFEGLNEYVINKIRSGIYCAWFNEQVKPPPKRSLQQAKQQDGVRRRIEAAEASKKRKEEFVAKILTKEEFAKRTERRRRAIAEGGVEKLQELEHHLRVGGRLNEPEWELLTRLRVGLQPNKYAAMQNKGVTMRTK